MYVIHTNSWSHMNGALGVWPRVWINGSWHMVHSAGESNMKYEVCNYIPPKVLRSLLQAALLPELFLW